VARTVPSIANLLHELVDLYLSSVQAGVAVFRSSVIRGIKRHNENSDVVDFNLALSASASGCNQILQMLV
jgi:hypothetical protein